MFMLHSLRDCLLKNTKLTTGALFANSTSSWCSVMATHQLHVGLPSGSGFTAGFLMGLRT